jgi:hypothetical protein
LNILFARCTSAVAATGTGKNNAKAGISNVPSPKPENSVRVETSRADTPTIRYSMMHSVTQ